MHSWCQGGWKGLGKPWQDMTGHHRYDGAQGGTIRGEPVQWDSREGEAGQKARPAPECLACYVEILRPSFILLSHGSPALSLPLSASVSPTGPLAGNPMVIFNSCKQLPAEGRVYTQHSPGVSGEQGKSPLQNILFVWETWGTLPGYYGVSDNIPDVDNESRSIWGIVRKKNIYWWDLLYLSKAHGESLKTFLKWFPHPLTNLIS